MRTYYAINYKDPGDTAWIWTGSTTETREEAQRLIVQLRQANGRQLSNRGGPMTRATVTLPDGYCARDVTVFARDNGDGTCSIEAFDAGGGLWPVCHDGIELRDLPSSLADHYPAALGERLFATPSRRP